MKVTELRKIVKTLQDWELNNLLKLYVGEDYASKRQIILDEKKRRAKRGAKSFTVDPKISVERRLAVI